jgi:uncharacterized protein
MANDFPLDIVHDVRHRPWSLPREPWIMTQSWHDLLFAHWPVAVSMLADRVPRQLQLDMFDGTAWLGVVPFHMTNVAPRALPALPGTSAFPELNVRTYVTCGGKSGVYFFSLDAANRLAVAMARALFHLPYHRAVMRVVTDADWIHYDSRRTDAFSAAAFRARYRAVGAVFHPTPGTLEYFLTERYCLYTVDSMSAVAAKERRRNEGRVARLEIHHPPWRLQPAEATIDVNTMTKASGITLPAMPPLLHFAKRQDAVAWRPRHL